jgi:effector-binding domain-containing protein
METRLDIEVGIPVETPVTGDGPVSSGLLPAGRYAVVTHTGPYDGLVSANAALLAWAEENGIAWQMSDDGKMWGARIEWYETDPAEEPDPQKWETELAFLVAEA